MNMSLKEPKTLSPSKAVAAKTILTRFKKLFIKDDWQLRELPLGFHLYPKMMQCERRVRPLMLR